MPLKNMEISRWENGSFSRLSDLVIEERRVDICLNGPVYASVMAEAAQLDCLALGFLFGEGVIEGPGDIKSLEVDGLQVRVEIFGPAPPPPERARSSGFGLGSVAVGMESRLKDSGRRPRPFKLSAAKIISLMHEFNCRSELFQKSGAVHSTALIAGSRRYFAEDVGRHNALDKVVGAYLADSFPQGEPALILTSGRVSTEIMLKTARAGLGGLISRSAPTDRAVEMARELDLLLIGFARGERFNIYHGADNRVIV